MHRDVWLKNILVMSVDPPRAVLCDYGKATRSSKANEHRLGPIPTIAPEVDGKTEYDNKIDIWGLGYVCCWVLFPAYFARMVDNHKTPKRNVSWYTGLLELVRGYRQQGGPEERSFADLARGMIEWDPRGRPTAAQALQYPCMRQRPLQEIEADSGPASKVAKTSTSTAKNAKSDEEIPTQVASDPSRDPGKD